MRRLQFLLVAVAVLAVLLPACAPKDPLDQIAETRARYAARLNGFYVTAEPEMEIAETTELEEGVEPAATGDEEAIAEEPQEPVVRQDALLDIIVQHDSNTKLPGITLDIVMVDAGQQEKARWLHFVDTSTLEKANQLQLTYTIEDVPYVEGDGFSVEVRTPVPAAEYGDYREFSVTQ